MPRFDWYQATIQEADPEPVIRALQGYWEQSSLRPSRAMNGYLHGYQVHRGDMVKADVWWGGNPGVHVKGTGECSPAVAQVIRARWPEHRVSRMDACVDFDTPGVFDRLSSPLIDFACTRGITMDTRGDWPRQQARTLYLGSPKSVVRLVLYEKGYEVGGGASLDWVRLEVRVRPAKADGKRQAARMGPEQVFQASTWLVDALARCGYARLEPYQLGTVYQPSDEERKRYHLALQYHRVLRDWMENAGTAEQFTAELRDTIAEALVDDTGRKR